MPTLAPSPHNIVVVLTNKSLAGYHALTLEHNKGYVPSPTVILDKEGKSPDDLFQTPEPTMFPETQLTITLDDKPDDPLDGYVFGSEPEDCFVLLNAEPSGGGVSRRHFQVDYNWDNWPLVIRDTSTHGTIVESKLFGHVILQ